MDQLPDQEKEENQTSDAEVKHEPILDGDDSKASPEVGEELSKVATSPNRNMLVFVAMAIGFLFMAWSLIGPQLTGENDPPIITDKAPVPIGEKVEKPSEIEDSTPPIPQLPEPPKLMEPTIPKAPSTPPMAPPKDIAPLPPVNPAPAAPAAPAAEKAAPLPTGVLLGGTDAEEAAARLQAKRKSPIQLLGGDGGARAAAEADAATPTAQKTQLSDFQKRGDLNFVLGKGKVIEVVTETAINSDHPSEVRAVVTRDVFAESGKYVLIPRGTRVFGEFTVNVESGYGRVNIVWNRIDLATGYTITLSSPAVDNLGRAGTEAVIDNKYTEQMANALLNSAFSIAVAAGVDKVIPPVKTTQNAANTQQAQNIQNTAMAIYNSAKDPNVKILEICSAVQNGFSDKTSAAYTTFVNDCLTIQGDTATANPAEKLTTLMSSVTKATTSLISQTAAASVPSHKQQAAEQAFKDLSSKMQEIVKQKQLKPTTTVDQGKIIKIYVNRDYLFPKDAILRARVIK